MGKALAIVGFRNRGQWEPGKEFREDDRCQIGKSWVIAKEDHKAGESFAEDADKWYYLVDARGLDDLDAKLAALTAQTAAAEEATLAAKRATVESQEQTAAAKEATGIFTNIMSLFDHDSYLYAITDVNGMVIWGIRRDGSVYQPKGISEETRAWLESLHTLEEIDTVDWLYAIVDSLGNVLWGIQPDGTVYEPRGVPEEVATILQQHTEQLAEIGMHTIQDDNYVYAIVDSNNNVLFGLDHKGASVVNAIKGLASVEHYNSAEFIYAVTDSQGNLLYGVRRNGAFYTSKFELPKDLAKQIAQLTGQTWFSEDEKDMEFMYRIEDKDGHVVFGIFYSGDTYMPKGVPTEVRKELDSILNSLREHSEQITYVKEHGKDWSAETSLHLPIPCVPARVEITGTMPSNKYVSVPGTLKYSDMLGNSFEKPILWSNQGNISAGFDKKNFSIDLLNTAGDEDDTFSIKFGGWVPQDSFHLKSYYSDFFKIRSLGVYRHAEQIARTRDYFKRRPWDIILGGAKQTTAELLKGGTGSLTDDMYNGALGHPDGFPFMLWINGEPWGLYTWNLKKSKENYYIAKNDNDGKQLFFGDYPTGLFWHRNTDQWTVVNNNLTAEQAANYELWDATKGYKVGDQCYTEDVVNFEVGGVSSAVTIRRLFRFGASNATYTGYDYDEDGYPCLTYERVDEESGETIVTMSRILNKTTMNPSHINWNNLEVRNPKKTICVALDGKDDEGNQKYKLEYYDYDSPSNYSQTGIYERTHEIISGDMFTQKQVTALIATGEVDNFSKKEYNRSVNTRKTLEELSWVFPIIETSLSAQNLADWGFESEADAKKAIFSEHWDTDHNIDFFLVLNDSYTGDSLTHNTLYTMYDGKKVFCNHYDTDFAFGLGITYGNSFPSVYSDIYRPGGTAMSYLWAYYQSEIKARWAELRDAGTINKTMFARMVNYLVASIGFNNYEEELRLWPQPSYRASTYWRMPAGSIKVLEDKDGKYHGWDESINCYDNMPSALKELYDADPTSVAYDETKQYRTTGEVAEMYCVVADGDTIHWYQCTVNCKGIDPTEHYTCGSPASGGVFDTPQRIIEWFAQRIAYMDSKLAYTPSASAEIMEAIQGAVATDEDVEALFNH